MKKIIFISEICETF